MKWFIGINEGAGPVYEDMVKVAVHSAQKATSLEPFCLYDGGGTEMAGWLGRRGVRVLRRRSRWWPRFKEIGDRVGNPQVLQTAGGAFLRTEIPHLESLFAPGEHVLYTDVDVMFLKDPVPELSKVRTPFFAAAVEGRLDDFTRCNTGVMLMNVDGLRRTAGEFDAYYRTKIEEWLGGPGGPKGFDQPVYNDVYRGRWGWLNPTMNWKPYWGENPEAVIVHFHGVKPNDVEWRLKEESIRWTRQGAWPNFKVLWDATLKEATCR